MGELAVAVLGPDRPGVIAALTEVLLAEAGNLTDASMTILRGQFAMTLVVDVPVDVDRVEADLAPVADRLGLLVSVREVAPAVEQAERPQPYLVRVHGADRPGLVHRVAALLAARDVNITDLTTRLSGGLYILIAEVEIPDALDADELSAALTALAGDLGVHATLEPSSADLL